MATMGSLSVQSLYLLMSLFCIPESFTDIFCEVDTFLVKICILAKPQLNEVINDGSNKDGLRD